MRAVGDKVYKEGVVNFLSRREWSSATGREWSSTEIRPWRAWFAENPAHLDGTSSRKPFGAGLPCVGLPETIDWPPCY